VVNQLLLQLPADQREALLADASSVHLPVGDTIARVGDPVSEVLFPDAGVVSVVSQMRSGHQFAVAAVGAEGLLGLGALIGFERYRLSLLVLVEGNARRIAAARLTTLFDQSAAVRRVILAHVGSRMRELLTASACNRMHSHRQRLARWLLVATDKAGRPSLPVTHETLALMVGGPRHAVTVALNDLRRRGAIAHLRGRIEIRDRTVLVSQACECYAPPVQPGRS